MTGGGLDEKIPGDREERAEETHVEESGIYRSRDTEKG